MDYDYFYADETGGFSKEYRDRIVDEGGVLRLRERLVVVDTFTVESHISMPI